MALMRFKAVRCFQHNGASYWLIFEGPRTFGADPLARCDHEEHALQIAAALNHANRCPQTQKET